MTSHSDIIFKAISSSVKRFECAHNSCQEVNRQLPVCTLVPDGGRGERGVGLISVLVLKVTVFYLFALRSFYASHSLVLNKLCYKVSTALPCFWETFLPLEWLDFFSFILKVISNKWVTFSQVIGDSDTPSRWSDVHHSMSRLQMNGTCANPPLANRCQTQSPGQIWPDTSFFVAHWNTKVCLLPVSIFFFTKSFFFFLVNIFQLFCWRLNYLPPRCFLWT